MFPLENMHYSVTCLAKMHAIPRQTSGRDVRCCGVEGHHVRLCPPLSLLPTRLLLISDPHQQNAFRVHQTEELQRQPLTPGRESHGKCS